MDKYKVGRFDLDDQTSGAEIEAFLNEHDATGHIPDRVIVHENIVVITMTQGETLIKQNENTIRQIVTDELENSYIGLIRELTIAKANQ